AGPGRKESDIIKRLAIKYQHKITGDPYFGCVAEQCSWLQSGNASKPRVLKHATTPCKHLSDEDRNFAFSSSAGSSLGSRMSVIAASSETAAARSTDSQLSLKSGSVSLDFTQAGKEEWQTALDFCIMKLICVQGIVPNILDSDEWREFIAVATKNKLKATPSDAFEERHIPNEASHVHKATVELLKKEFNLTLTFDGGDTRGQDSVYTAHATTADRKTYFLHSYEGTDEHHDANWVKNFIFQSIDLVGREHFAALCSDNTGNTRKGRALSEDETPTLLDFPDPPHHAHNTIKDITNLPEFAEMKTVLRATIKYFSHSNFASRVLQSERLEHGVMEGLVKIGKTRFATHYSASMALDRCFPFIQQIILDKKIEPKNKTIVSTFTGMRHSMQFQLSLVQYNRIIDPIARSLWAMEGVQTNAADVFLLWLGIGAELRALFDLDEDITGIERGLAQKVIQIFNRRFKAFIKDNPDDPYFTTLYLDPRFVGSDILKKTGMIPTNDLTITIPPAIQKDDAPEAHTTPNPRAYRRAKKALKQILRNEVDLYLKVGNTTSIFTLVQATGSVKALVEEFTPQLLAYSRREYPFTDPIGDKSMLQWWRELLLNPKGRVVAFCAVKLYSILVNSMPDERWGSRKTRMNAPLRNKQKPSTIANMIQIGEWY
ncbi:ribonuclease H-like domain-containing protein, partial [Lentinula guzmanii]